MHKNEELVRRGFQAFATGDMATLAQVMSPDVLWVSESGGVLGGRQEGRDATFASFAKIPVETQGTFTQEVVEVFADDHVVVAITEQSATRRGLSLDGARTALIFVIKNDQAVEVRVIQEDSEAAEAFWAE